MLVTFPERAKQRRWTVLLRALLALPLAVVLLLVVIGTVVVVVIGWFGALATGRTPAFTRDLVTNSLRLSLRLQAYLSFMTDTFPAFSFEETPADVARLSVPAPTALNRWAVLIRLILVIPGLFLCAVLAPGLLVITVFMGFVVLITGWLPAPVHDAYRAASRYAVRLGAYVFLLVPTYPWGPFGDRPAITGSVGGGPAETTTPEAASAPPPSRPRWTIVLGRGARRVLVVGIALGIAAVISDRAITFTHSPAYQRQQLVAANNKLVQQINHFSAAAKACRVGRDPVACLEMNDHAIAEQLTLFADALAANTNAGIDQSVIVTAQTDAQNLAGLFYLAAAAGPSRSDYDRTANGVRLNDAAIRVQRSFAALQHALNHR